MKSKIKIFIAVFALAALITTVQAQQNTVTGDKGTKTTSFNGKTQTNNLYHGAQITVSAAAISATLSPVFNVQLQYSPNDGLTWINLGDSSASVTSSNKTIGIQIYPTNFSATPGASPTTLVMGTDVDLQLNCVLPKTWRLVYHVRSGSGVVSVVLTDTYVNYFL